MPKRNHFKKKNIFTFIVRSGLHLWLLLILSNVFVLYSLHFISFGQVIDDSNSLPNRPSITSTATPTVIADTPTSTLTPTPAGAIIDLDFSMPGIGSGGGNLKPKRPTRNVTIYMYGSDVNSHDNRIKPLYTIKSQVQYVTNIADASYTAFANHHIDLGGDVPEGQYQIAFKTDQSIRKIIKAKDDDVGGEIFDVSKTLPIVPGLQKIVMGDIDPLAGNNVMDIGDYNMMVNCYGDNSNSDNCPDSTVADLNDDGTVDGIDYNIMELAYQEALNEGLPVPTLPPDAIPTVNKLSDTKPTVRPEKPIVRKPTVKPVIRTASSNSGGIIIVFFLLIIIIGVCAFLQLKGHFFTNLLSKTKNPTPGPAPADATPTADAATPTADTTQQPSDASATASPASPAPLASSDPTTAPAPTGEQPPASANTPNVAAQTEIPITSLNNAAATAANGTVLTPPVQTAPSGNGTIDATYYLKKKAQDDKGIWVTLTGEEGALDGLYKGNTVEDGFDRIKGTMKEENGKKYVEIAEILPAE